ncbi:MAG: ABC transporter permease [Desulfobacteraceae bacterium]|nr:MAG: ABC transporter permease [Desulfobacteraceae bacterium]
MLAFLLRRFVYTIPVIVGVSVAVFLMIHLIPGDPAHLVAGMEATREDIESVRRNLGLNDPIYIQYFKFVGRAMLGDFGTSFRTGRAVLEELGSRYPNTLLLGLAAMLVAVFFGGVTGIVSAVRKYTIFDNLSLIVSLVGVSMPTFFLGLVLMLFFSVYLGWFPLAGKGSWLHLVLPAVTLGTPSAAVVSRMIRSSLVEVLEQDYIRTARAKGLSEFTVVNVHAVRNAMIPVVTVIGLQLGYLLGGAVVTETVFAWPGIGRLIVQSILARDFPVVQASVLVLALTFVLINLLTDLLYQVLDPRIRLA